MTRASNIAITLTLSLLLAAACSRTPEPEPSRAAAAASAPQPQARAQAQAPAQSANAALRDITVDESAQREAGIVVEAVRETRRPYVIQATGQITLSEDATWRIGATVDGRVAAVLAGAGDRVTRGQALARVHSHEVHEARAEYQLAKAGLERSRMLGEQARRVRDRTHRLFDLKAASREQLEAADTEFENASIAIANAQTALDKARVHITEFLDIPLDDEGHDDHDADFVPIKAPASGVVMERLATMGAVVTPGEHVFTVADLSTLWMIAAVNEADLSRLNIGQPARVSVKAYPDETFAGRVIKLGEALDAATRTLQVRIEVPNPARKLKPEMFATVAIESPRDSNRSGNRDRDGGDAASATFFVPPAAIQEVHGQRVIFVRTAPTRFTVRRVTLGQSVGGRQEITAGLNPGDQLVIKGAFVLKSELLELSQDSN